MPCQCKPISNSEKSGKVCVRKLNEGHSKLSQSLGSLTGFVPSVRSWRNSLLEDWNLELCYTKRLGANQIASALEPTSFPGSLFSASLSSWNRDPGCGWSRDYLSILNRRVGGYSRTVGREDDKIPHPSSRFVYHPDSGWSSDQPQPANMFSTLN